MTKVQSHKPKNLLYCAFCNKTIDDMKNHYEKVHPDLKSNCKFCHKRFKSSKIMERHVKVFHEVEKNFFCDLDLKGFAEKYQLRRHMQTHCRRFEKVITMNKVKSEQESGCEPNRILSNNDFNTKTTDILKKKVKINLEEILVKHETFSDDESTQFETKSEQNESIVIFTEEISSNDKKCQSKDTFENSFVKKMLKCKQCDELFDDLDSFHLHFSSTHKTKYEQPNTTTCTFCHKTFAKVQFLKLHIAAIHEKSLFECEICGKKFSFERAKKRHVEVVHKNQRNYKCSHCQKLFGTKTQMKEHEKYYHSTEPLEQTHFCKFTG